LADCEVVGPKSNVEFLEHLIRHPSVTEGRIDTSFLDAHLAEVFPPATAPEADVLAAAAGACLLHDEQALRARARRTSDPHSPWAISDGWRLGHAGQRVLSLGWRQERRRVTAHGAGGEYRIDADGQTFAIAGARLEADRFTARLDGEARRWRCRVDNAQVFLHDGERRWTFTRLAVYQPENIGAGAGGNRLLAPMPGRIVLLRTSVGDHVVAGQELGVMEAMKMELSLKAPRAGRVAAVQAKAGDFVDADAVLVRLEDE
jgi:3-methylcrotonyl-CoA carboxylase alpha subunit